MHQDKKVGLALALLVIGFVAAFCLRQDRNTTVQIPELNDPHYLNEQIADKDRTPYLDTQLKEKTETQLGSEQAFTGLTDKGGTAESSKVAVPTISHTTPVGQNGKGSKAERWGPIPEFLKDVDLPEEQFSSPEPADSVFEPNPPHPEAKPVSQNRTPKPVTGIDSIKPEHNNAWEVNPSQQRQEPVRPVQPAAPQIRIHTVKAGETLSEISIHYLGTSRKYREIFNLNRDQLRSPNDIREGMKLRIPVYRAPETTPQSANRQTNVQSPVMTGKRTMGQMVSQPTLKSDTSSSTVQFEGLIESLSNTPSQKSMGQLDQKQVMQELEESIQTEKLPAGIKQIPENYRKFIPVPRSPLTPGNGSQSNGSSSGSGRSLSQVQPENVDQIVDDLFGEQTESTTQQPAQPKTYTIQAGDTLESIAVRIYGKRSAAFKIYQQNRDLLKNANYIRPGMKLNLP
ncbi:LysM peptidoglycan-binding domain-containing protein [Gimesia algae]|uniref:LysM domain/BON superfamily protein n=1 Tax=Gimesia algae TaxID=2527971 RepID=A0A517V915_9PLAN|nr:LysM peptidoglycan-binding domain-containing protein [Gimesia algae]QDT89488.1 LysM domain/BON superfamily protein [Gimesia algae]